MGEVIRLDGYRQQPDLDSMGKEQLQAYLEQVQKLLAQLDLQEPEDMESPLYDDWANRHEELEDEQDEVLERLDQWQP